MSWTTQQPSIPTSFYGDPPHVQQQFLPSAQPDFPAGPPRAAAYAQPAPFSTASNTQTPTFQFRPRADGAGWLVYDVATGQLLFDAMYLPGSGVIVGQPIVPGAPSVASVKDHVLSFSGRTTTIRRKTRHNDKLSFVEPKFDHEYSWRELDRCDELLLYPSKTVVARGEVHIAADPTWSSLLRIIDVQGAPELPILVASYAELLRVETEETIKRAGRRMGDKGSKNYLEACNAALEINASFEGGDGGGGDGGGDGGGSADGGGGGGAS